MAGSPVAVGGAGGSSGLPNVAGGGEVGGDAAGGNAAGLGGTAAVGGTSAVGGTVGLGGSSVGVGGEVSVGGSGGSAGAFGGSGPSAGNTAGGAPALAGAGGSAGQSSGGAPAADGFTLLFRDEFDAFDAARWQIMTHSWDSNLALFSSQSVSVANGELALRLLAAPSGTVDDSGASKPYFGAEVRSVAMLTYGRVRARAKLASGSAVVSALVTIYTPWPADNWNELDIECLGQDASKVQLNTMVYTGPPTTPPVTTSVTPTQAPHLESLGFDASADFHLYTLEWTPAGAVFLIDDAIRYTWTENIALMTLPQNVLMTIWASSSADWAGAVTASTVGASATYDWIELYTYATP